MDKTGNVPECGVDEPATLTQFLDVCRAQIVDKVADLTDTEAAAHLLPATAMTAGGIVKHLACAEDSWFQAVLLGRTLLEPWASAPLETDRDWPFHSSAADPVGELVRLYELACARSRVATGEVGDLGATAKTLSPSHQALSAQPIGPQAIDWVR